MNQISTKNWPVNPSLPRTELRDIERQRSHSIHSFLEYYGLFKVPNSKESHQLSETMPPISRG